MIIQDKWGNVFYIDDEDAARADELGFYGVTDPEDNDHVAIENLFHSLPKDQLEVVVCLFLGMKPEEIVKALRYRNIARFYTISARLRESYKARKALQLV